MNCQNISCFVLLLFISSIVQTKYTVTVDLSGNAAQTEWTDITSNSIFNACTNNAKQKNVGLSTTSNFIHWKRVYTLPKTNLAYIYFEYQISGFWNNYEIQIFTNNLLAYSETLYLNDINRSCNQNFLYESYVFFVINQFFDVLNLEIKVNQKNLGLYLQNIVINQRAQAGRNEIIPFYDYIVTCTPGSGLKFIQYYCACVDSQVYKESLCQASCGQNYVYDSSSNTCYQKDHCSACLANTQVLTCDNGYFKLTGSDISASQCVSKCPGEYYGDTATKTCLSYTDYLSSQQNNGYPVNHYFFFKSNAEFFHFFKYNDFMIQIASIPLKLEERSFVYLNDQFVIGTYTTFKSQEIQIFQVVHNSQHKLRVRATAHFVDFYPSKSEFYINGILQPAGTIIASTTNLQEAAQDYYIYYDVEWVRTEETPVVQNAFSFIVDQPLQDGSYKGYFYIDDFHVFQFECLTGCNSCYTYRFCTPCLNPANKNPADCTCLSGYVMKNDVCITCPTYCTTCVNAGVCVDCKVATLRINSPACDTCPVNYYLKANTDNCQPCITGCKVCSNDTACTQCNTGYFRNSSNVCVAQCPDGQFNDASNVNDPKCTICNNNCLKCQTLATTCTACKGLAILVSGHCYLCTDGQYLSGTTCINCIANCQSCSSATCLTCADSFYYKSLTNQCLGVCDDGYFGNSTTRTCDLCNPQCVTCAAGTNKDCLTCPAGKVLNIQASVTGECQATCLAGYYKQNDGCAKCWKGCSSCIDGTQACLVCASKYYRLKTDENCYETCPDGYYNNSVGFVCSTCNPICKTCNGSSDQSCLSCSAPLAFYQNQCLKECYDGYGNINNICTQCSQNCKSCFGTLPNQCLSCTVGFYYLNNQCYTKCPTFFNGMRPQYICKCIYDNCVTCDASQFFLNNFCYAQCPNGFYGYNGLCIKCDITCGSCFGEGIDECITCANGLVLLENQCLTSCPGNLFRDANLNECKTCDNSCFACDGPNQTDCTACFDGKLLNQNGLCSDVCLDGQYPVLSEKKCYSCHPTCLTCFGSGFKNCLTCPNQQYVYLYECVSTCPDGFVISQNGVACDPNTAIVITQCAYQCETCELTARFCKKCAANRSSNAPNCDCEAGYYDDGSSSACPSCANKCLTCTGVAANCLKCKGDRMLPQCNCPQFYYDDGESVNCIKCQDNCLTCDSSGCIQCLGDRIHSPICECPNGYYEAFTYYCKQCSVKCQNCAGSALLCLTCSGIRENPPICGCPSGYFENSDEECQQCDPTCKDCNQFGCISCAANRVGPVNGECACDKHGISRYSIGQVYCTDCFVGVPYFGLNDDFTGFYFEFGGQVQIIDSVTGDLCAAYFPKELLQKLGTNPNCDKDFNVLFGENPEIEVTDLVTLNSVFILMECNSQFSGVLPYQLSIPSTIDQSTHLPFVRFKDTSQINICEEIKIEFDEQFLNGGQNLEIIEWQQTLPVVVSPEIQQILQEASTKGSNTLLFPPKVLQPGVLYKIKVTFKSFAQLKNTASLQIQGALKSTIKFEVTTEQNQFHRFEKISLQSSILYSNCIEENPPQQKLFYEIILKNTNEQLLNGTISEGLTDGSITQIPLIEFEPYFFQFKNPYSLILKTKLSRPDYNVNTQNIFNIYIIPSSPTLTIAGGNRMIGYTEDLYLNTTIQDLDLTKEESNQKNYTCFWSCQDIINGTACSNQENKTILFDNSCNQKIPGRTFAPYQVFNFEVFIEKELLTYSTKVSIQLIEMDLPALMVEGPIQDQIHNYYDEFRYKLTYPGINPDILMYAGAVIYDQITQATFQFHYLEFKFKIQNYFTNFDPDKGNIVKLRLSVYDPRYIMPSLNTQMLILNIPPSQCQLQYQDNHGQIEFIDAFHVKIDGCEDQNQPLLYSVLLFPNFTIYQNDLEQSNFYHYTLLVPPQETSEFQLSLPFLNKQDSFLVFNIQNSQEGITNITQSISVKQYLNISEQDFRNYQNTLINLDEILIGYLLITERLKSIADLWEYKEELIFELIDKDKNQSYLSNQTETLYKCISNLLSANVSLIENNETVIINQVSYRIELAKQQLVNFADLQKANKLTSSQNIDKTNYVKQYYTFTNILSSYVNYRVAKNVSATEIQDQLNSMINYLQDISVANEPMYKVQSNSVNMDFGFLTTKMVGEITGSTVKDDSPSSLRILETQADSTPKQYNSSTNFFKFSQTRFIDNPFYTSDKFPKNSSGYQAVDPKMINTNSTSNSTNLSSAMKFKFPAKKTLPTNTSTKCIAQVSSGDWNADVCKSVKKDGETVCECHSVNPTSIMESLDYLMDKAAEVYSLDTLLAFASFPFYKTIVFYFYLIITGGYAYIVYWGQKVDNVMFEKIAIEKEIQAAEQKLKEEQEKLEKEQDNQEKMENQNQVEQKSQKIEQDEIIENFTNHGVLNTEYLEQKQLMEEKQNQNLTQVQRNTNVKRTTIFSRSNTIQLKSFPSEEQINLKILSTSKGNDYNENPTKNQIQTEIEIENNQFSSPFSSLKIKDDEMLPSSDKEQNQNNDEEDKIENIKDRVLKTTIAKIKAYIEYLKYFHQILSIIYKDDSSKPRGLRASIIYTSIMGSLAVLFVFGQIDNITLTLTLALITAPLNKIYQIILEKTLSSTKKPVRIFGAIVMIVSAAGISYTMLAGLVLSGSVETANQWSYIFIGTFSLDNIFYSPIQLIFQYGVHIGLINMPIVQKLLNQLLDKQAKEFLEKILFRRR